MNTVKTEGGSHKRETKNKVKRPMPKGCNSIDLGDAGEVSIREGSYRDIKRKTLTGGIYIIETKFSRGIGAPNNTQALIKCIKKGLPMGSIYDLSSEMDITPARLLSVLDISPRTLVRRKKKGKLEQNESERLYRVGHLFERAIQVLGSKGAAQNWLKTPKKALGNQIPLDYADTEIGAKEVDDLLGRLEHGVFS